MDELEKKRKELLEDINKHQQSLHLNETERRYLIDLKDRYNLVVQDIERARPSPLKDPLDYLPTELWEDIVDQVVRSTIISPRICSVDVLLDLTCISSKWEKAIICTPHFWTNINVASTIEDMEAKLTTCLVLSADLPIDLHLMLALPIENHSIQPLINEGHRIKSIYLSTSYSPQFSSLIQGSQVATLLGSFGSMPLLEGLHAWNEWSWSTHFTPVLQRFNSIKSSMGCDLSSSILELDSFKALQSLITHQSLHSVLPFLESFDSLRDVTCVGYDDYTETAPKPLTMSVQSTLPWISLVVMNPITFELLPILARASSTLTVLQLHGLMPWGTLPHILALCSQMKRLYDLRLAIQVEAEPMFGHMGIDIKPTCEIERLSIELMHQSSGDEDGKVHSNIGNFYAILPAFAPKVRKLDLGVVGLVITPLPTFVEDLPRLNSFTLSHSRPEITKPGVIRLSHVRYVDIRGPPTILSSIHCSEATKLTYTPSFYPDDGATFLDSSRWSNIRVLDISGEGILWDGVSLPHVEKLVLGPLGSRLNDYMSAAFFVELALHPTAFPCLWHIKMRAFIEWDVVFLMLERRNFLIREGVPKITKFSFPCMPPLMILHPLCARLRGKFSERPSNLALSLEGNAATYLDPTILGCGACLRTLLPCQSSLPPLSRGGSRPRKASDFQLPPYPSTPEEVLSSFQTRKTAWAAAVSASLGEDRLGGCDRCTMLRFTKITGLTCFGLPEPSKYQKIVMGIE